MKQFDEKFSRKAKEAFDNFNADHLAGEGWNSFKGSMGRKRTRAFIIPLWAKVASVAAMLTIVVLLTNRITNRKADEPGQSVGAGKPERVDGIIAINKEDTAAAKPCHG